MRTHEMEVVGVRVTDLRQHPDNANNGDVDAIEESIEVNGFFAPILVQRSTGYILVGNHRFLAAQQLGAVEVPVIYLDVDDQRAKRIMVADNRTARLGHDDEAQLAQLLGELYATDAGLHGTGYESQDFEKLMKGLQEPLDFDEEPLVDDRLTAHTSETFAIDYHLIPVQDEDGNVTEVTISLGEFESWSKRDFQHLRALLGMRRASREEIDAFGVRTWK